MTCWFGIKAYVGLNKTFFFRSSKSAFSRHDNVRASSTLFIWLNENVEIVVGIVPTALCLFTHCFPW